LSAARAREAADELAAADRPAGAGALALHAALSDLAARHRNLVRRFTAGHPGIPVTEVPALSQDVHDVEGLRAVGTALAGRPVASPRSGWAPISSR